MTTHPKKVPALADQLRDVGACGEAVDWAETLMQRAWDECPRADWLARFCSRVDVKGRAECWTWTGATKRSGYGQFSAGHRTMNASRWSWVFANGEVPDGMHVLHRCDEPACVNPNHLFLGTHLDNMRDKVAKGRQARTGNRVSAAKTHCPSGHPYAGENLMMYRGMRYCRACSIRHKAAYVAKTPRVRNIIPKVPRAKAEKTR